MSISRAGLFAVVSLTYFLPKSALADEALVSKGGAQYFVGTWGCTGQVKIPNTPFVSKTVAHLQAEAHGRWVVDRFQNKGALGFTLNATGRTYWDYDAKILHRFATDGNGHTIEWINHGGWHDDVLELEGKATTWFGLREVWLLDVFIRTDDTHFHHLTYYAKDSHTWEPFYEASCDQID